MRVAIIDHVARVNALSAYGTVIVSVMVVMGFFGVLFFLLYRPLGDLTDSMNAILNILLGALTTNFVGVVNYWIGSSAGSARKDAAHDAPKTAAPPTAPTAPTAPTNTAPQHAGG
jgi:hypothetical protein